MKFIESSHMIIKNIIQFLMKKKFMKTQLLSILHQKDIACVALELVV